MKNPMLAKSSLLLWATALSVLFGPFAGNAQNSSISINLEGTEWQGTVVSNVNYSDNSVTTVKLKLTFSQRGKVTAILVGSRTAGVRGIVNPSSGSIITSVTPPTTRSQTVNGTYTVNGKSVHLEFSDTTIRATGSHDELKCVLTHKSTGTEEKWVAYRISPQRHVNSRKQGIDGSDPSTVAALNAASNSRKLDPIDFSVFPDSKPLIGPTIDKALWNFRVDVDRLVGSAGVIREESHQFEWLASLTRKRMSKEGEEWLEGSIVRGSGERGQVCADAKITGFVSKRKLTFWVTYKGSCCNNSSMWFSGTLSDDSKNMTGNLEPIGLPEGYSCSLMYAKVTATRR